MKRLIILSLFIVGTNASLSAAEKASAAAESQISQAQIKEQLDQALKELDQASIRLEAAETNYQELETQFAAAATSQDQAVVDTAACSIQTLGEANNELMLATMDAAKAIEKVKRILHIQDEQLLLTPLTPGQQPSTHLEKLPIELRREILQYRDNRYN